MGTAFFFQWEVTFMEWLQGVFSGEFWVTFFSLLSEFGEDLVCVAVLGIVYWGFNKKLGKTLGINIVVNLVWNPMIKNVFSRRRPYFDNETIKILKPVDADADIMDIKAQGFSFPSGHSSNSATVFGTLFAYGEKKWLKVMGVVMPVLVGISRVVLGAHYPTDVLCGWILGVIIVLLVPFLRKKINNDIVFFLVLALIGIPGFFYCTSNDFYSGYGMMIGCFAGMLFEEKAVNFENTESFVRAALRTVMGGALFFGLNTVFKLPFPKELLESASFAAYIIRTIRYALVVFLIVGVYPMLFKYTGKIGKKDK